jgi:dihydrolipoamide dehydrogenase
MNRTQVAVIGAGPGGYVAAFRAADLGMQVTLIDLEQNPGGVCSYRGCIPSKTYLHAAALINESKEAAKWGIDFGEPSVDAKRLNEWKNEVVAKLTGGLGGLVKSRKITYVQGRATFTSANAVSIDLVDGGTDTLEFDHAILATGSRPAMIPAFDIGSDRVVDSTGGLEIGDVPGSLLVLGGGYIGLELGSVYAALGTDVSVVEMTPTLLPGADRDLVKPLQKRLEKSFSSIMMETMVTAIEDIGDGVQVSFKAESGESEELYEKVLVSIGRRPNTTGLGLENTGVEINERGFIVVDPQRRTAEPSIFAVGDIAGEPMLAHKASHEGVVAAEAINGSKAVFEPQAIPAVVFTDPEIAWTGITETQAKADGIPHTVAKFPWTASGRATTLDRNDGMTKVIVDPETELILGVGIVGPGAGDMISEATLAIEMGAVAEDLALTIHPHPTLSETVMEAAEVFYGQSAHMFTRKRR